ncbi:MAG: hypothetical protein ABSF95_01040 [Verrucomicrobiota bacterium]|jgi:starvation-inducible outer membrane lipoprotein
MKAKAINLTLLALGLLLLPGCISVPPLIQVEHKDASGEVLRRLDRIDHRLDDLEKKVNQPAETKAR